MLNGMLTTGATTATAASGWDLGAPTKSTSSSAEASWPSCDGDGIPNNCPPLIGESSPSENDSSNDEPNDTASVAAGAGSMSVGAPAASSASGSSLLDFARQAIGTDYVWGSESLSGMDCSGLVTWVYEHAGISLNGNRTADQIMNGGQSISLSAAQPGDLVGYKTGGHKYTHMGIYIGDGKVIDASNNNDVVVERTMWDQPDWQAVTYR